jgi:hypothetical protein
MPQIEQALPLAFRANSSGSSQALRSMDVRIKIRAGAMAWFEAGAWRGMPALTRMALGAWLCCGAVLAFQVYGISGLVAAFLPSRHIEPGYAEWSDYSSSGHLQPEVAALYDRLVWMVIDALPASWVLEEPSGFPKTRALLTAEGLGLTAICQPPTVTMPRRALCIVARFRPQPPACACIAELRASPMALVIQPAAEWSRWADRSAGVRLSENGRKREYTGWALVRAVPFP